MHATDLIEANFGAECQAMHKLRFTALKTGIEAALVGKCVSVTGLGRRSPRPITEKASVKQIDRLVGNPYLVQEAPMLYRAMAHWSIAQAKRPLVLVDWSPVSHDEQFHVLRASVPAGGRGKTLYQEVHPQSQCGNRDVQLNFLRMLGQVIPQHCRPIIVTDAGFKNPWFRAVAAMGWDWIGRIRGTVQVARPEEDSWLSAKLLGHLLESDEPTFLGEFSLAKSAPLSCAIYGLRKPPKGRVDKTKKGRRSRAGKSRENAAREREPWVIATSLSGGSAITNEVIDAYAKRMQIEEAFRDTKDEYYGLGLNRARSRSAERFAVLLLINALALFIAWLFGKVAEQGEVHFHYQANTIRTRRVLSFVFLGLRVLARKPLIPGDADIRRARSDLATEAQPSIAL